MVSALPKDWHGSIFFGSPTYGFWPYVRKNIMCLAVLRFDPRPHSQWGFHWLRMVQNSANTFMWQNRESSIMMRYGDFWTLGTPKSSRKNVIFNGEPTVFGYQFDKEPQHELTSPIPRKQQLNNWNQKMVMEKQWKTYDLPNLHFGVEGFEGFFPSFDQTA